MNERDVATLQAAIVSCLADTLSNDQLKIKAAEVELKAFEVTEEYGEVLAVITVSHDSPLQFRQLASVLLKHYVEGHWSEESEKFTEPVPNPQTKVKIRKLLPKGLGDSQSKIRTSVVSHVEQAYAVSAIAHWDWPEEWPELFEQLMAALSCGDPCYVHGCMRVLDEFCHIVTDQQLPLIAPLVLPQLLKVFVEAQLYEVRTRARVVHIFTVFCGLIFAMADMYPDVVKTLLVPVLPQYLSAFVHVLSLNDENSTDPGLRKELIMSLCNLLRSFPHLLLPHVMEIVTPVWNILVSNTSLYVSSIVNAMECSLEVCDSDGDIITYESTVFAIFEFISALVESHKFQKMLVPILPELMYYLFAHLQITEDQAQSWLNDVNEFVNEDENEFSYSVRLSALDLINTLCEEPGVRTSCYRAVVSAVERHLQEAPHGATSTKAPWWKIHEACFLIIGNVAGQCDFDQVGLNCHEFLEKILLPDLMSGVCVLLTGRCLWLGGKLALLMKPDILRRLLEGTGHGLHPSQHAIVRVLASKAAYQFCSLLGSSGHLKEFLPVYLEQLVQLATQCPEDVVSVVLDALTEVVKADKVITSQYAGRIVSLLMALFLKFSHDPAISSCVEELFASLASAPGSQEELNAQFLPTALHVLQSHESQLPPGITCATLDIAALLVRGYTNTPFPEVLVTELFPAVVKCVLCSDDSSIVQSGGECVRSFISVASLAISTWMDASGCTGVHYLVQVILHMLDPSRPEFTASFVGKLLIVFVKKMGSCLGEHLELLLKAVLSKMQIVETSSVMQSLLCVFAHLVQHQLEAVVSFLSGVPDPSGQPALHFVLNQWCAGHSYFFGVYETRVSSLALCKLLAHCLTTQDSRLLNITVKVESSIPSEDAQDRVKQLPLPLRIMQLIIADLQVQLEAKQAQRHQDDGTESAEESDEWEEDDMSNTVDSLVASNYPGFDTSYEGVEEDPDLQDEAVLHVDMESQLTQCLRDISYTQAFPSLVALLTNQECQTLHSIGIPYK